MLFFGRFCAGRWLAAHFARGVLLALALALTLGVALAMVLLALLPLNALRCNCNHRRGVFLWAWHRGARSLDILHVDLPASDDRNYDATRLAGARQAAP